jgi:hypothetical protein
VGKAETNHLHDEKARNQKDAVCAVLAVAEHGVNAMRNDDDDKTIKTNDLLQ